MLWPALALGFIVLDRNVIGLFNEDIYKLIAILSIVPPAANIAAFAAQLNVQPEKAATTVLIGTIFALFYIPFTIVLVGLL